MLQLPLTILIVETLTDGAGDPIARATVGVGIGSDCVPSAIVGSTTVNETRVLAIPDPPNWCDRVRAAVSQLNGTPTELVVLIDSPPFREAHCTERR